MNAPYLSDRAARGFSNDAFLGPSWEDQWAHLAARGPAWTQGRQEAYAAIVHRGRLPRGLEPHIHALCAASLPSPFLDNAKVADDIDFALRKMVELGPGIADWRRQQLDRLFSLGEALRPFRAALDARRSRASVVATAHVHLEASNFLFLHWVAGPGAYNVSPARC